MSEPPAMQLGRIAQPGALVATQKHLRHATRGQAIKTLNVILKPSSAGWSIYLADGREVARFRGLGSHRRALRYVSQLGRSTHQRW